MQPIPQDPTAYLQGLLERFRGVRDGKVAEHTANRDDVGMMVQLGLIKRP